MPMIYAIRNTINGFAYVGCTAGSLAKRMREHRCLLNQGKHTATMMLDDWKEHGQKCFEIVVLEELAPDASVVDKRVRELYWMQVYGTQDKIYNAFQNSFAPTKEAIAKGVESSRTSVGNRWSEETNEKRRVAQLGKPKGHGAKISETKRRKKLDRL